MSDKPTAASEPVSRGKKIVINHAALITSYDAVERRYCLTHQQAIALLSICDYFEWATRWKNLQWSADELQAWTDDLRLRLMRECPVDCEEVEGCLGTSTIINNINTEITTIETDITTINTDITTIETDITNIYNQTDINIYPPAPDEQAADALCSAAVYIVNQMIDLITQVQQDAQTITLEEFLAALLGIGGYDQSLLVQFWNWMIANSYPNLIADVEAVKNNVIRFWYCNLLDRDLTRLDIQAAPFTQAVKDAYTLAIDALTDSKFALFVAIGQALSYTSSACLCAACGVHDFELKQGFWITPPTIPGQFGGVYVETVGFEATLTANFNRVGIELAMPDTDVYRIRMWFDRVFGERNAPADVAYNSVNTWLDTVLVAEIHQQGNVASEGNGLMMELFPGGPGGSAIIDQIMCQVTSADDNPNPPSPAGYARIYRIEITCA